MKASRIIKELIAGNKTKSAIDALKLKFEESNPEVFDSLIILESLYHRATSNRRLWLISNEEFEVIISKVQNGLLEIAEILKDTETPLNELKPMKKRWFWYVSDSKIQHLNAFRSVDFGFIRETSSGAVVAPGVPWGTLIERADTSKLISNIDELEMEIKKSAKVVKAEKIHAHTAPLLFEFSGIASKMILNESYGKENDTQSVFLLVGIHERTGVALLGSASNMVTGTYAKPRSVDPSGDPAGTLLDVIDQKIGNWTIDYRYHKEGVVNPGFTRVGVCSKIFRSSSFDDKCLLGFSAALKECQKKNFFNFVKSLAVFSGIIEVKGKRNIEGIEIPDMDSLIIGSPVYVEQIENVSAEGSTNI